MTIMVTANGYALVFKNLRELRGVVEHLEGMAEWIERDNRPAPHVYAIHTMKREDAQGFVEKAQAAARELVS
jgi:hypothetical protein